MEWWPDDVAGQRVKLSLLGDDYVFGSGAVPDAQIAPALAPIDLTSAAVSVPAPASGSVLLSTSVGGDIYAIDPTGENLRFLGTGVEPSWAPALGGYTYAVWAEEPVGIYLDRGDGSPPQLLAQGKEFLSPEISPDGSLLAYLTRSVVTIEKKFFGRTIAEEDPRTHLVIMPLGGVAGSDPREQSLDSLGPSFSPDSRSIVWKGDDGLYIAAVNGGIAGRIPNTDHRFANPRWSPDGSLILFMWRQHDHWEIGTIRLDGTGFRLLAGSRPFAPVFNKASPVWSPDGSRIAYLSDQEGPYQLFVMNAEGGDQHKIGDLEFALGYSFDRLLSWAP